MCGALPRRGASACVSVPLCIFKVLMNTANVTGGKPIAILLQSISGVSAINPLVAFYDIHRGKREVLFFYLVPDTTRDY
jgi:hypothetical protein